MKTSQEITRLSGARGIRAFRKLRFRNCFLLFILLSLVAVSSVAQESDVYTVFTEVAELAARREFSAALELFDRIDEAEAQTSPVQLMRATILNSAGRHAEARTVASGIVSREPENVDAMLIIAAAFAAEGRTRDQRLQLERILTIEPQNLRVLSDLGFNALRTDAFRTAAGHFERALAIDENFPEALVGRAVLYRFARNPQRSEQLLNRAIQQNPHWATPFHERARLYRGAGFLNDALNDLNTARRLEPDNYWISVDRAITLIEMGRREEALEELDRAVPLSPESFIAYVYRAGLRDQAGDFEGAAEDFITLMRIRPEYFFAAEGLGIIRMRQQRHAEARDAFLAAYRQAPREFRYALLAAYNWMMAGRPTDPRQFLSQVLRTAPRDSPEWHLLRMFHDRSGDIDVAARAEREQNFDNRAIMTFYLGLFHDAMGRRNTANSFFLRVRELNRRGIIEWNMNEMMLEQRGLGN